MGRFSGTSIALDANDDWDSGVLQTGTHDRITGLIYADQAGTLFIEQSADGQNWDLSEEVAVVAETGQGFSEELVAPFTRVRFENGPVAQSEFRISVKTTAAGTR